MLIKLINKNIKTQNCLYLLSIVASLIIISLISNSDLSNIILVYGTLDNSTINTINGNINNLSNQADSLYSTGKYEEALNLYDRILDSNPNNITVLKSKADSLSRLGNYQGAIAWYERALAIDPNNTDVLNNKGNTMRYLGEVNKALEMYDKALSIDANYTKAMMNKAVMFYTSSFEVNRGVYWIDKVLAIEPENVQAIGIKANLLYIKGQFEYALSLADSALRIEPDSETNLLFRGLSLIELKRYDDAVLTLNNLVKINPNNKYVANLLEQIKLKTR